MKLESKDDVGTIIINEGVIEYIRKCIIIKDNVKKLYFILLGQASKPMQAKLIILKNFKEFDNTTYVATLLLEIKDISHEYKGHRSSYLVPENA